MPWRNQLFVEFELNSLHFIELNKLHHHKRSSEYDVFYSVVFVTFTHRRRRRCGGGSCEEIFDEGRWYHNNTNCTISFRNTVRRVHFTIDTLFLLCFIIGVRCSRSFQYLLPMPLAPIDDSTPGMLLDPSTWAIVVPGAIILHCIGVWDDEYIIIYLQTRNTVVLVFPQRRKYVSIILSCQKTKPIDVVDGNVFLYLTIRIF